MSYSILPLIITICYSFHFWFLRWYRVLVYEFVSIIIFFFNLLLRYLFFDFFLWRFIVHGSTHIILEWLLRYRWWCLHTIFKEFRWLYMNLRYRSLIIYGPSFVPEFLLLFLYFLISFVIQWPSIINEFFFFRWLRYDDLLGFAGREQECENHEGNGGSKADSGAHKQGPVVAVEAGRVGGFALPVQTATRGTVHVVAAVGI